MSARYALEERRSKNMGYKAKFAGIHPVNGGSMYLVKAGDVEVFTLVAVKSDKHADVNLHPLFIMAAGSLEPMLQTKNFVSLKHDHKGERFSTTQIRFLVARYGHHYAAQVFVTKADYTETVPDAMPLDWQDETTQDEIDEDGEYGL